MLKSRERIFWWSKAIHAVRWHATSRLSWLFLGTLRKAALDHTPRAAHSTQMFFPVGKYLSNYTLETQGKLTRWPIHAARTATYRKETGSTGCSLPPSPRTCRRQSACHCTSWQTRRLPTPPKTYTPGRCCRRQRNAAGSWGRDMARTSVAALDWTAAATRTTR